MRISTAFPSDYLRAADLQGKAATVLMSHVDMRDIGGDHKPVLYFQGKERGLVLNKTNSNTISTVYGDDTDMWAGHPITLFETMVDFQGRMVAAIRVKIVPRAAAVAQPMPAPVPQRPAETIDESIPF